MPMSETAVAAATADEAAARTARHYDAVPYVSVPYPKLHTARLCATARLFGHPASDPRTARTLEIGCASAGHLIPLAATLPDARFVGVDVSPVQVAEGQARIARLGLRNITLATRSFTDLGPGDTGFDYILCHGVFSWITEALRDALMRVCKERLAPGGVVAMSFNVLPGWRLGQAVRDTVLLHAGGIEPHSERVAAVRELITAMGQATNARSAYGAVWREYAERMLPMPDSYLAHELFEDNNTPLTFADFNAKAEHVGLAHLAEAQFAANLAENMGEAQASLIDALGGGDGLAREQAFDLVTGRTFRTALLVHEAAFATTDRHVPAERFAAMHVIAPMDFTLKAEEDGPRWLMTAADGQNAAITEPRAGAALETLDARRPKSSAIADLATEPGDAGWLAELLRSLVCRGFVDASVEPVVCAPATAARPLAWWLAASDAAAGLGWTATLRHTSFQITPPARLLLPLLDGSRDRSALLQCLVDIAVSGVAQLTEHGAVVTDPDRITALCQATLDRELATYARSGLLVEAGPAT